MFTLEKRNLNSGYFALLVSFLNFLLFHHPFFQFAINNLNYKSLNGLALVFSLVVIMLVANAFVFYLTLFLSQRFGKFLIVCFFMLNALAVYFVNTYGVIIDKSMIGNILNTNFEESSSFFSIKLIIYLLLMGVLPSVLILKINVVKVSLKRFSATAGLTLLFMLVFAFANATNWLWIDKNAKTLGGLAMPWSYTVNTSLFYLNQYKKNKKAILLPNATIKDTKKTVMVLVIGESARSENFSLYGYQKNTNPLLASVENLNTYKATSCATYTTAGVKCILDHKNTDKLYEILPNYLYRNGVDVIWRTTNWGEPPVHINNYQNKDSLTQNCEGNNCSFDEVLINDLSTQILASKKDKILVVLHASTSHGPTYSKKYPKQFENFRPVCNSVELANCSNEALVNAYDNTILYTDFILYTLIENLKQLKDYNSAMIFVSDHGESLGENNLYMHGLPISIAPKEQFDIPFLLWYANPDKRLKPKKDINQNYVFHSVLNFLNVDSPIYNEEMDLFVK